jgi:FkbM family methyltransferase
MKEGTWQKIPYLRFAIKLLIFSRKTNSLLNASRYIDWLINKNFVKMKIGPYIFLTKDPSPLLEEFTIYDDILSKLSITPKRIVDLGAYMGDSLFYFALRYPKSIIHGYEASPRTHAVAKYNIKVNNLQDRIKLFNEAVTDKKGFVEFVDDFSLVSAISDYFESLGKYTQNSVKVRVPSVDLPTVIHRIEKADLLKVDIEGSEYLVFKNFDENLSRKVHSILIEFHKINNSWKNAEKLIDRFQSLGYRILDEWKTDEKAKILLFENRRQKLLILNNFIF